MSTETIQIIIREDGSRAVKRNIDGIGESAEKSDKKVGGLGQALGTLKAALATLGGALFLNQLRQYADEWTEVSNRVRLNTMNTVQAAAVQNALFEAAQRTRTEFKTLITLYGRAAQAGKELGVTQQDLVGFSEGVGMALAVQGVSATEASGALLQLGQMLSGNKVQAQEFNAIIDGAPRILQAMANNIKGVDGSLGRMREQVKAGKITAQEAFAAFMKDLPKLREEFAKANPSISQAFTVLNNSIGKFIGESDQAAGVSTTLARGIIALGEHLPTIAKSLVAVGAGMVVAFGPTILGYLQSATAAVARFTAALAANPFTALAVALAVIVTALVMFRDELVLVTEGSITLGDYMRAVWSYVKDALTVVGNLLKEHVLPAIISMWEWFQEGQSIVAKAFRFVVGVIRQAMNYGIGLIVGFVRAAIAVYQGLPDALKDLFFSSLNAVIEKIEWALNKLIAGANALREFVGMDPIELLDLGRLENSAAGAAGDLGAAIKEAFVSSLDADYVGAVIDLGKRGLDALTVRARQFAQERQAAAGAGQDAGLNLPIGDNKKHESAELKEINRELDHKIHLMSLNAEAREIDNKLWQIQTKLQKEGVTLSAKELEQLRLKLVTLQGLTRAEDMFPDLFEGTNEQIDLQLQRLQQMYAQIDIWRRQDRISEETAQQMKAKVAYQMQEKRLDLSRQFFGTLAQLQNSNVKEMAAIGKAAAIAQATIDGILAVQKALAAYPPPGNYALAAAIGAVTAANVANIAATGFRSGGYTGNLGTSEVAGVVHGREFVVNADATARNRATLEAMNAGASVGGGGVELNVSVENYSTASIEVQRMSETEVRIIARDEARRVVNTDAPGAVAADLANPNGRTSKAINQHTTAQRRR